MIILTTVIVEGQCTLTIVVIRFVQFTAEELAFYKQETVPAKPRMCAKNCWTF